MSELDQNALKAGRDLIAEAITEQFGERCPSFESGCFCCQAWVAFDALPPPSPPAEYAGLVEKLRAYGGNSRDDYRHVAADAIISLSSRPSYDDGLEAENKRLVEVLGRIADQPYPSHDTFYARGAVIDHLRDRARSALHPEGGERG